jgi:hypothetical protein
VVLPTAVVAAKRIVHICAQMDAHHVILHVMVDVVVVLQVVVVVVMIAQLHVTQPEIV